MAAAAAAAASTTITITEPAPVPKGPWDACLELLRATTAQPERFLR